MKVLLLILSLFLATETTGQSVEKIRSLLKEKDFASFKYFVDNPPKTNVEIKWERLRDIIPGYQEGIVRITEYPLTGRDTGYTIYNYSVKFLATEKSVFYYVFQKAYGREIRENKWKMFYSLIDSFSNQSEYNNFLTAFSDTYNTGLIEKDLFDNSIVYGGGCGLAGVPTEYQQKLDSLLKNKDIASIRSWLRSANSEKQLFAIQGLMRLEDSGIHLKPEDKTIIDLISKKDGMVYICSGCIMTSDSIQNVVNRIMGREGDEYFFQKKSTTSKTVFYTGLFIVAVTVTFLIFSYKRRIKNK